MNSTAAEIVESVEEMNGRLLGDEQSDEAQYLTFILGGEEYGVDILRVQEINGWEPPTLLPNTPDFVKGVINLRGAIVPIIDLRIRFGLDEVRYDESTVVIVLHVRQQGDEEGSGDGGEKIKVIGVVVDAVSDVSNVDAAAIRPAPDFRGVISSDYVSGLATVKETMLVVLDVDRMINDGVMEQL